MSEEFYEVPHMPLGHRAYDFFCMFRTGMYRYDDAIGYNAFDKFATGELKLTPVWHDLSCRMGVWK